MSPDELLAEVVLPAWRRQLSEHIAPGLVELFIQRKRRDLAARLRPIAASLTTDDTLSPGAQRFLSRLKADAARGVRYWTLKRSDVAGELAAAGLVNIEPHHNREIKITLMQPAGDRS
mgnify:CR=1 FL=1